MKSFVGITGCTGSLGKILLKFDKNKKFICFLGDIRKFEDVENWIKNNNFIAIIHLAAIVPIKDVNSNKKIAKDVNFLGTKNIVKCIKNSNIKWFFFASTSHVYKSSRRRVSEISTKAPISYYGKTKLLAENYILNQLKKSKTRYCIARIFSTSNKEQKKNYLVPDLIKKIKNAKKNIKLYNLNHYRDFITMSEISKIIIKLYKIKFQGIINIGRGKKICLKDIARIICEKYKKNYNFIDNRHPTYLIANNNKLKKYYNLTKKINLKDLIL